MSQIVIVTGPNETEVNARLDTYLKGVSRDKVFIEVSGAHNVCAHRSSEKPAREFDIGDCYVLVARIRD